MKFAKLSIAALAVIGFSSSAVAMDMSGVTAKPYVKTKLYYETIDRDGASDANADLFNRRNASGQVLATAGISGALDSCWGYGFEYNVADTLGLENILVNNTRMGAGRDSYGPDGAADFLQTQDWASQAYVTYSPCNTVLSNTTFKVGRQFLDTPLAFTEKWNLAPNSFDAIVALNQDIKGVTLVGAYVGKGNGTFGRVTNGDRFSEYGTTASAKGIAAVPNKGFGGLEGRGAYAVGAMTSLLEGMPINLWYYDVVGISDALWADAGYTLKLADDMNVGLGVQYGQMMPKGQLDGKDDSSGFGVKLGGKVGIFGMTAAYSKIDTDGIVPLANTATAFKKTKLYTAGIYTDGTHVAQPGSEAFKVKAVANMNKIDLPGKIIAQYVHNENETYNRLDVDEIDAIYAVNVAGIGIKAIYINRDYDQDKVADKQHVRLILSKNF